MDSGHPLYSGHFNTIQMCRCALKIIQDTSIISILFLVPRVSAFKGFHSIAKKLLLNIELHTYLLTFEL